MLEIVNKKTGETIIFPSPDHSKPAPIIDSLPMPEMEICIRCGKATNIPKDLNIDFRKTYVEGAGQLCGICYNLVYNTKLP